ncbi:C-reactive protein-like [Betta splendens]|uniref:Pentraxin family member n=1 Tax=Betta splendens TaxID=158456 RepID=A0A6P7KU79_BETSP|nr:C-reactive protein-like [Betta splendens]
MEMPLVLLLVMMTACAAIPQDLSGKMFTFPEETNTAHVKLTLSRQSLGAVTVCLRFFTDLNRDYPFFSVATPSADNAFLIFKTKNNLSLWAKDKYAEFAGHENKLNVWHSVCATWDAASGIGQVWLDGKPSSRKFISDGSISGVMIGVLGQEQDKHGGGFDMQQSFVGMMSDVHMWDYVLQPKEMLKYANHFSYTVGNVLNWEALDFQIVGRVLIEGKQ